MEVDFLGSRLLAVVELSFPQPTPPNSRASLSR